MSSSGFRSALSAVTVLTAMSSAAAILGAQADIYVSKATGNDTTGTGTVGAPFKTAARAASVFAGVDASVFVTWHILDLDAGTDLEITHSRLQLGGRILCHATAVGGAPTAITTAGAESLSGSGTARKITTTGANWALLQSVNGQGPRIRNVTKGTCIWGTAAESATVYRVGPAHACNGAALVLPTIGAFTESANGDTIVCETLQILGQVIVRGTFLPEGTFLVVENAETNGGDQTFTSDDMPSNTGPGRIVYLNCGIGSLYVRADAYAIAINSRIDQLYIEGGVFAQFGGVLFWSANQSGGTWFLNGALSGSVPLQCNGGRCDIHAPVGVFDVSLIDNTAAFQASYNGFIQCRSVVYGSGSATGVHCIGGGSFSWSAGHKPIVVGETQNVLLDSIALPLTQIPASNESTASKAVQLDAASAVVRGLSTTLAPLTGAISWDANANPEAHCIATGNCTITPSNLGPTCKARLEFVPGASHRTLTISGVTFTTQFTQAALTTLCGTAASIFVDIENRRGTIYVMSVVST